MKTKSIAAILASLTTTTLLALDSPPVGSAAPDFSLTDAKGKTHSLSQYKGKYVVLEWFNPDCPFVKKHYGSGNMQKLQEEFTAKGVVWLSIDSSAPGLEGYLTAEQANTKMAEWKTKQTAFVFDPDGKRTPQKPLRRNSPGKPRQNPALRPAASPSRCSTSEEGP